jgi:hypothetical protein
VPTPSIASSHHEEGMEGVGTSQSSSLSRLVEIPGDIIIYLHLFRCPKHTSFNFTKMLPFPPKGTRLTTRDTTPGTVTDDSTIGSRLRRTNRREERQVVVVLLWKVREKPFDGLGPVWNTGVWSTVFSLDYRLAKAHYLLQHVLMQSWGLLRMATK